MLDVREEVSRSVRVDTAGGWRRYESAWAFVGIASLLEQTDKSTIKSCWSTDLRSQPSLHRHWLGFNFQHCPRANWRPYSLPKMPTHSNRPRSPTNSNEPDEFSFHPTSRSSAHTNSSGNSSHPNPALSASQQLLPTLASKPHAFSGAVLTPEHARGINAGSVLSLASALSLQAANAAMVSLRFLFLSWIVASPVCCLSM